ncbi:MAG: hypothetical protein AB7H43_13445 [Acidimicrobiia bacterium]
MTVTPPVVGPTITASAPTSTSYVANLPRAAAAGELIVIQAANNEAVATPSGYTLRSSVADRVFSYQWTKVAAGGETSVTLTLPSQYNQPVVFAYLLTGVNPGAEVAATGTAVKAQDTNTVAGSITNTAVNQRGLAFQASKAYGATVPTGTTPAGWTDRGDVGAAYGYVQASAASRDFASSVGSQPVSVTLSDFVTEAHLHTLAVDPTPDDGVTVPSTAVFDVAADWSFSLLPAGTGGSGGAGGPDAPTQVLGDCHIGFRRVFDTTIHLSGGSGVAQNEFELGDQCYAVATFVDNNDRAQPKDPTTVRLLVQPGDGAAPFALVYGVDAALVKLSTGVYAYDTRITRSGTWRFRAEGTGAVTAANLASFVVPVDPFYPDGALA